MAHFAKIDADNKVVSVHSVHNNELLDDGVESEQKGIDFLQTIHNNSDTYIQTSYNTYKGVHGLGGTPFRKNYAGKGFTYDEGRDAFIPKKPFTSWILDEDTCQWEAPTAIPVTFDTGRTKSDGNPEVDPYTWNEDTTSWDLTPD
tara:strand:- start:303 stop:737 length:435 start_codon:yes stop_codon:yes gene_type:complete